MAATEQLYERAGRELCSAGEEGRLVNGSGFPVLSIGTAQEMSFFLSVFLKKGFLGNAG